jgi:hypothetical protein
LSFGRANRKSSALKSFSPKYEEKTLRGGLYWKTSTFLENVFIGVMVVRG